MINFFRNLFITITTILATIFLILCIKNKWYEQIITKDNCNHQTIINDLNSKLEDKQNTIDELNSQLENKNNLIDGLNSKIKSKNTDIANLEERVNELNSELELIKNSSSNNQIIKLNKDIEELNKQITQLENEKSELQAQLNELISSSSKVYVIYEFNDNIYKIVEIEKGSKPSAIEPPESTAYLIFNCWKLNGVRTDPTSEVINSNTTFTADLTYKFDVNYLNGNSEFYTEIITKNQSPIGPLDNPTKDGYRFIGWSLDGINVVDYLQEKITATTNFIALFEKLDFIKLNTPKPIAADYCFTFKNNIYGVVNDNNTTKIYIYRPETDIWEDSQIGGLDGITIGRTKDIWSDGENLYFSFNSLFQKIFDEETNSFIQYSWNEDGYPYPMGQLIWTDGENYYESNLKILDKENNSWVKSNLNWDINEFSVDNIVTVGNTIYYLSETNQYIFDKTTKSWNEINLSNFPSDYYGPNFWSDGENLYYSDGNTQLILDKSGVFINKKWTGIDEPDGYQFINLNNTIYYFQGPNFYKLNIGG